MLGAVIDDCVVYCVPLSFGHHRENVDLMRCALSPVLPGEGQGQRYTSSPPNDQRRCTRESFERLRNPSHSSLDTNLHLRKGFYSPSEKSGGSMQKRTIGTRCKSGKERGEPEGSPAMCLTPCCSAQLPRVLLSRSRRPWKLVPFNAVTKKKTAEIAGCASVC